MNHDESPLAGRHILVVEDEFLIALTLQQMLEDLGSARVDIVHSVAEALGAIEKRAPDCALLDLNLGHEYSFAIGDTLRQKNIPYVFCTAHAANAELFFPNDADTPRINKPVVKNELKTAVASVLGI